MDMLISIFLCVRFLATERCLYAVISTDLNRLAVVYFVETSRMDSTNGDFVPRGWLAWLIASYGKSDEKPTSLVLCGR